MPAQSFLLLNGDTINRIDANNLRQGHWKMYGKMLDEQRYKPDQVIEEGEFINNKKQGIWTKYFPSGKVHTIINYVNNRPNGSYKVYYENGQLEEEGDWRNNKNVGNFKRYYENGKLQQEFVFNNYGKRDGVQKYYHENGQLMIIGEVRDGKETGEFKEYYEDGKLKSAKFYDEPGVVNHQKTKEFAPTKETQNQNAVEIIDDKKIATVEKDAVQNEADKKINPFNGNGDHTLYNKNRQISQKGFFKNYKLINGLYYRYDENGILKNIEQYRNGKYIGDAPLEEDTKK